MVQMETVGEGGQGGQGKRAVTVFTGLGEPAVAAGNSSVGHEGDGDEGFDEPHDVAELRVASVLAGWMIVLFTDGKQHSKVKAARQGGSGCRCERAQERSW